MDSADTQPKDSSFGYQYLKNGNIWRKDVSGVNTDYEYDTTTGGSVYDSDIMTKAGNTNLTWDPNNGYLTTGLNALHFYYNWDGKLNAVLLYMLNIFIAGIQTEDFWAKI